MKTLPIKREWVPCPVCGEPDMERVEDTEGNVLIRCVNHACASNGGNNAGAIMPDVVMVAARKDEQLKHEAKRHIEIEADLRRAYNECWAGSPEVKAELESLRAKLNKRVTDYLAEKACCNGLECACQGVTLLEHLVHEEAGQQLVSLKASNEMHLEGIAALELSLAGMQSERDHFKDELAKFKLIEANLQESCGRLTAQITIMEQKNEEIHRSFTAERATAQASADLWRRRYEEECGIAEDYRNTAEIWFKKHNVLVQTVALGDDSIKTFIETECELRSEINRIRDMNKTGLAMEIAKERDRLRVELADALALVEKLTHDLVDAQFACAGWQQKAEQLKDTHGSSRLTL